MRITCPNCGAQYEVDDALIPETGRDVQCSSCGKGWFQSRQEPQAKPTLAPAAMAQDPAPVAVEEPAQEVAPEPASEAEVAHGSAPDADLDKAPETPPEAEFADTADFEPETDHRPEDGRAADLNLGDAPEPLPDSDAPAPRAQRPAPAAEAGEDPGVPPAVAALPPRKTDETVLAVLREEAEREIAQRRQEASALESQPDLGLPEQPGRGAGHRPVDAAEAGGTRQREILPDIDAINSSLRSEQDRRESLDQETLVEEQRRGFRMGFGIMLGIAVALIALYVGADWLAETVPALAPALAAYLDLANALRTWIDGLLAAGVDGLSALLPPPADG